METALSTALYALAVYLLVPVVLVVLVFGGVFALFFFEHWRSKRARALRNKP